MLNLLPALPDQATFDAMAWWTVGGAAIGFGATLVPWLAGRKDPVPASLHIPGAPKVEAPAPSPWGAPGLASVAIGAAIGALAAWGWYSPDQDALRPIGIIVAIVGVLQATWKLLGVLRDTPAVGEAPPEDAGKTVAARLPGAWGGIAMACLGALMTVF